ncbi:MAG: winged helix-turn-helix transcriptional regulator [Candidatus ainarchaeum sp.]|nr:winged helix-turn-helix transcriptional regulator [Candidatus ainarchaeum sp.]MDD3976304.1 winged helix-turn-helix transcriptional regulator [Candidatus ainarchaeum sp.]
MDYKYLYIFINIFLIISISNIYSLPQEINYIGNFEFNILNTGITEIKANTNYNLLDIESSQEFISKNKEYWTFEILTPVFKDYFYSITLPENSIINYIHSDNNIRIYNEYNKIKISSIGQNEKINIKIQYTTDLETKSRDYISFLIVLMFFIIFGGIYYLHYRFKKNKPKKLNKIEIDELNFRQKKIIEIIKKEKFVTQNYLSKTLDIPKGSLSRNIDSLIKKEIIEKKKFGNTFKISLK